MSKSRGFCRVYRHFYTGLLLAVAFLNAWLMAGPATGWGPTSAFASGKADGIVAGAPIADLVERLTPAVVNLSTVIVIKNQRLNRDFTQKGMGSGFIISEDGYIFTNNHVVAKASRIKVKLSDGKEYDAEIKGTDPNTDIALIKIAAPGKLPYVRMGDSERLRIGEGVFAIGNPLGLNHTVTSGIISAKGREIGASPYDNFLQTDASINPGNSGGPLCNLAGEVIGINTAIIAQAQGIGFAIPINMAKEVLHDLKTTGKITRGWLGVTSQDITEDLQKSLKLRDRRGALVTEVFPGDVADKAGIKPGDVIVGIDGKPAKDRREVIRMIAALRVGSKVGIQIFRDGKEMTLPIVVAERKEGQEQAQASAVKEQLDMTVQEVTPEIARFVGLPEKTGVIVTNVKVGGPAEEAGLQPRDIILKINNNAITGLKDYQSALNAVEKENSMLMLVRRGKANFFVTLKKGK